jgi:hypothetical protein
VFRTVAAAVLLGGLGMAGCASYPIPSAGQPIAYLQRAQAATRAHQSAEALTALDRAENTWLLANAARGNPIVHHERPALRAMGDARVSVQQARWGDAEHYIAAALSHVDGPNAG